MIKDFEQETLDLVAKVAKRFSTSCYSLKEEDLQSELSLWLCLNRLAVERYEEQKAYGKIYISLRNAAQKIVVEENTRLGEGLTVSLSKDAIKSGLRNSLAEDSRLSHEDRPRASYFRSVYYSLTSQQRDAAELCIIHGLSYEEAAKVLGVTPMAVKKRIYRVFSRFSFLAKSGYLDSTQALKLRKVDEPHYYLAQKL